MLHIQRENFSYDRSWVQIETMLVRAEKKQNDWIIKFHEAKELGDKETMKECARNKKALEGVVKTLRWTLGDRVIENPLS
jgi:hypothetical protein